MISDGLRDKIRHYLCDIPMSPDPNSEYGKLGREISDMCKSEGVNIQDALNEVALEWRLVGKVMDE